MSINDEQFEGRMQIVEVEVSQMMADQLRTRDTDQREALARVEAEKHTLECRFEVSEATLSCIRGCLRAAECDIDQLKLQLAEALWHLDGVLNNLPEDLNPRFGGSRSFLTRHAQAEQQEAQGAQAGEFWTWLDLAYRDGSKGEGRNFTKYNMEVAYRAGTEAVRAALATQPAAGEPVAPIGYANPKHLARMSAGHMGSVSVLAERSPDENHTAPVFAAPPAAPVAAGEPVAFANELISGALQGGDFSGADIQELAVKHGLLREARREEPCRDQGCACAEYGFPTECYRKTAALAPPAAAHGDEAVPADLKARCQEIVQWRKSGVLKGDSLRRYAKSRWPEDHSALQMAEHETATEAFQIVAAMRAQAGEGGEV